MQNQVGVTFVTPEVTLVTSYFFYSSCSWSYKCNSSLVLHKILLYLTLIIVCMLSQIYLIFIRNRIIYLLLQSLKAFKFFVSVCLQIFLDELKS